jgi:U4/U6.U5 tri-snRNP-associated protein 2
MSANKRKANTEQEEASKKMKFNNQTEMETKESKEINNPNNEHIEYKYDPKQAYTELTKDADGNIICPYLDTIERKILDFDFEKLCSVSLVNMNVYACLVCGKYFQGNKKKNEENIYIVYFLIVN